MVFYLYGVLIKFYKKVFLIKVSVKENSLASNLQKELCYVVETLENSYFKSCAIYKKLQSNNEIK